MLHVRGVTVWDTGTYTCEIEADMENHITLSHFLQVLGKKKQDWYFDLSAKANSFSQGIFLKQSFCISYFCKDWSYLIIY